MAGCRPLPRPAAEPACTSQRGKRACTATSQGVKVQALSLFRLPQKPSAVVPPHRTKCSPAQNKVFPRTERSVPPHGTKCSPARNKVFLRTEQNVPAPGTKCSSTRNKLFRHRKQNVPREKQLHTGVSLCTIAPYSHCSSLESPRFRPSDERSRAAAIPAIGSGMAYTAVFEDFISKIEAYLIVVHHLFRIFASVFPRKTTGKAVSVTFF